MNKPIKYLTFGLRKCTGKNFSGRRSILSKGSGRSKRRYRIIDFYRLNYKVKHILIRIEYDPNRSSLIGLICYKNGFLSYILLVEGVKVGKVFDNSIKSIGLTTEIYKINTGSFFSCLEIRPFLGAKIARSAGCFCFLVNNLFYHNNRKMLVRLPSGEERFLNKNCKATLGIISNSDKKLKKKRRAGDNYYLGYKPKVRGVAKNSVDHPNGGGRGKTSK